MEAMSENSPSVAEARKVLAESPTEMDREETHSAITETILEDLRITSRPFDWEPDDDDREAAHDLAAAVLNVVWPLIEGQQTVIAKGHAALEAVLAHNEALMATCSCGATYVTYEGPEPDCPVHGAVQALNEAHAEIARLKIYRDRARDGQAAIQAARHHVGRLRSWYHDRNATVSHAGAILRDLESALERPPTEADDDGSPSHGGVS